MEYGHGGGHVGGEWRFLCNVLILLLMEYGHGETGGWWLGMSCAGS